MLQFRLEIKKKFFFLNYMNEIINGIYWHKIVTLSKDWQTGNNQMEKKNTNPNGWYLKQAYVDIKAVIHVVPRVQARKHSYFMMFTTHTYIYVRVVIIRVRSGQEEYNETINLSDFKTVILQFWLHLVLCGLY
jgi:hypothetical protein